MKAEQAVIVTCALAVAGAEAQDKISIPVISNKPLYEVVLGTALFLAGYMTKMDGISDAVEAFGFGYAAAAAAQMVLGA
jgi:hypothetical protein